MSNVGWFPYAIVLLLFILAVGGLLIADHFLADFLKDRFSIPEREINLAGGAALIVLALVFHSSVVARCRSYVNRRLLPVNNELLAANLDVFEAYDKVLSLRIRKLMPARLREKTGSRESVARNMVRVRAEEQVTVENKSQQTNRIEDLLAFLNLEYLIKTEQLAPPVTLQGEPGSGKSTLIFELYRQQALRLTKKRQGWFPLLVFAHELSWDLLEKHESLKELLVSYFEKSARVLGEPGYGKLSEFLRDYYEQVQFLIIVDGLDEIPNRPLYENMASKLNVLFEREWKNPSGDGPANRYLLSCRTDDNQQLINSRLINLFSLEYSEIVAHFRRLRRHFRKDDTRGERYETIVKGLAELKRNRLLQNYVQNPYLLSLILDYLGDEVRPPATRMAEVFEHVLRRELAKPTEPFENSLDQTAHVNLSGYLVALLAPYCFRKVLDTLEGNQDFSRNFRSYIEHDRALAEILIGGEQPGYLRAFWREDVKRREEGFNSLATLWGDTKTEEFRDQLDNLRGAANEAEFVEQAISWLQKDIMTLLEDLRIAEVDMRTYSIVRFRHRRMQDYFMALFLEKVGVNVPGGQFLQIDNAWLREPLRILAAISSRPEQLLQAYLFEYEERHGASSADQTADLNRAANLLLNASEAIAYLPKVSAEYAGDELEPLVTALGNKAQELYYQASQISSAHKQFELAVTWERRGWLVLEDKCLRTINNIYASEFLKGLGRYSFAQLSFAGDDQRSLNSWQWINRRIQQKPNSHQHLAYEKLYPIKALQNGFPIARHSLFYYIVDTALCFGSSFDALVKETHPTIRERILPRAGFLLEKVISAGILAAFVIYLYDPWKTTEATDVKILRTLVVLTAGFLIAIVGQILGFMSLRQCFHLVLWGALVFGKRLWRDGKFEGLSLGRWLERTALPFVFIRVPLQLWRLVIAVAKFFLISLPRGFGKLVVGIVMFIISIPRRGKAGLARLWSRMLGWSRRRQPRREERIRHEVLPSIPERSFKHLDETVGASSPGEPFSIARSVREFIGWLREVGAAVFDIAKAVAKFLFALVLTGGALAVIYFGVPFLWRLVAVPIANRYEGYSHRRNVDHFNQSIKEVDGQCEEFRKQVSEFMALPDSAGASDTGKQLDRKIGEYFSEITQLFNSGQTLQEYSREKHPLEYEDIQAQLEHLSAQRSSLQDLQSAIRNRLEHARYAADKQTLLSDSEKVIPACASPATSSATDQSEANRSIRDCIERLDRLIQRSKDLQTRTSFYQDPGRDNLVSLTKQMTDERLRLQVPIAPVPSPSQAAATAGSNESPKHTNSPQPAPSLDPLAWERPATKQRIDRERDSKEWKDLAKELAGTGDLLAAEPGRIDSIRLYLDELERGQESTIAYVQKRAITKEIDFLDKAIAVDNGLANLQERAAYRRRVLMHLKIDADRVGGLAEGKAELDGELASIEKFEKQATAHAAGSATSLTGLRASLQTWLNRTQVRVDEQTTKIILGMLLIGLFGICFALLTRKLGSRRGRKELNDVKGNFDELLRFITHNSYTVKVNKAAIDSLRHLLSNDPKLMNAETFKQVSNAAELRLGKLGELNEEIGRLLKGVADGMDNILNRRKYQ